MTFFLKCLLRISVECLFIYSILLLTCFIMSYVSFFFVFLIVLKRQMHLIMMISVKMFESVISDNNSVFKLYISKIFQITHKTQVEYFLFEISNLLVVMLFYVALAFKMIKYNLNCEIL